MTGSDIKDSHLTRRLEDKGARVFIGHHPSNIQGADMVVYTAAVKEDNPEIQEAKRITSLLWIGYTAGADHGIFPIPLAFREPTGNHYHLNAVSYYEPCQI